MFVIIPICLNISYMVKSEKNFFLLIFYLFFLDKMDFVRRTDLFNFFAFIIVAKAAGKNPKKL